MSDRLKLTAIVAGSAVVVVGVGLYLLSRRHAAASAGGASASGLLVGGVEAQPAPGASVGGADGEPSQKEMHERAKKAKDLGNKRFQGRQYDKAVEEYTRAVELAPDKTHLDVAVFYGNRAQAHAMLDRHAEAESDCDHAIAIDPRYVKALNRRAVAREKQGRLEGAFSDFTAASLLSGMGNEVAAEGGERVLKSVALARADARLAQPMRALPSPSFISTFVDSSAAKYRVATPKEDARDWAVALLASCVAGRVAAPGFTAGH